MTIPAPRGALAVPDRQDRAVPGGALSPDDDAAGPEGGLAALIAERRAKAEALRSAGRRPVPAPLRGAGGDRRGAGRPRGARGRARTGDARVRVAGRLAARRGQGKVAFLDLDDRSGRIQLWASVDRLGEEAMAATLDLDLGDIVGAAGPVARTRRGELSVAVDEVVLLAKALRPPPDKHAGLRDPETALPPALPRPDRRPRGARRLRHPLEGHRGGAPLPRRPRLRRGRDAHPPADLRRRGGAAVRDPPQRARPRPLPAHRHRALPQAPASWAASSGSTSWARTSATRA